MNITWTTVVTFTGADAADLRSDAHDGRVEGDGNYFGRRFQSLLLLGSRGSLFGASFAAFRPENMCDVILSAKSRSSIDDLRHVYFCLVVKDLERATKNTCDVI